MYQTQVCPICGWINPGHKCPQCGSGAEVGK